ncbi:MAG: LysR family transcriptional regulator [Oribacterium sp.]|nr:LysR family transcriptional regulator [Oribacterium sp.]
MEIEYLREFLSIVRNQKMSEAAEELFTTPSSLSKHMKALEEELGVPLFKKVHRNSVINEYGEALIPFVKEIVRQRDKLQSVLQEKRVDADLTLRIVSHYRLFEEILKFRKEEGVSVVLSEDHRAIEMLETKQAELAILIYPTEVDDRLNYIPYKKDRMVMVCEKNHPMANLPSVSINDLKNEFFVTFPKADSNPLAKLIFDEFKQSGIMPKISITATVGSTIAKLIAQDAGIGILWEEALKPIMSEDLCVVPLEPLKEIEVNVCWLKDTTLSENATLFIDFIKEQYKIR